MERMLLAENDFSPACFVLWAVLDISPGGDAIRAALHNTVRFSSLQRGFAAYVLVNSLSSRFPPTEETSGRDSAPNPAHRAAG